MVKEHFIGSGIYDNDEFNTGGAVTANFDFRNSGVDSTVDSTTNRYFNLGAAAHSVQIIPSAVITITKINGRTLKSPKTVGTNGISLYRISNLTLVTTADTNLLVFCKA